MIEQRGVEAARVLQGLIAMSHKQSTEQIEKACKSETTMDFMEAPPIIRSIGEYGKFIHDQVQKGIC